MGKDLADSSSKSGEQQAMFCLKVPHRLLLQWRKQVKNARDYVTLLNKSLVGDAMAISSDSDSVGARYAHITDSLAK